MDNERYNLYKFVASNMHMHVYCVCTSDISLIYYLRTIATVYSIKRRPRISAAVTNKNVIKRRPRINAAFLLINAAFNRTIKKVNLNKSRKFILNDYNVFQFEVAIFHCSAT